MVLPITILVKFTTGLNKEGMRELLLQSILQTLVVCNLLVLVTKYDVTIDIEKEIIMVVIISDWQLFISLMLVFHRRSRLRLPQITNRGMLSINRLLG
jgi:hypothetical protein